MNLPLNVFCQNQQKQKTNLTRGFALTYNHPEQLELLFKSCLCTSALSDRWSAPFDALAAHHSSSWHPYRWRWVPNVRGGDSSSGDTTMDLLLMWVNNHNSPAKSCCDSGREKRRGFSGCARTMCNTVVMIEFYGWARFKSSLSVLRCRDDECAGDVQAGLSLCAWWGNILFLWPDTLGVFTSRSPSATLVWMWVTPQCPPPAL